MNTTSNKIRGVLVDLSGTVHIGDTVISGAIQALQRLGESGRRIRFVTNTSAKSTHKLQKQLQDWGIPLQFHNDETEKDSTDDCLLTSVLATRKYLLHHNLRPFCVMEDTSDLESGGVPLTPPFNCVVVGLAPTKFQYTILNRAFRILLQHPKLIAIHKGHYLRDTDGELSLGPGGFVTALEIAANCSAVIMGKPSIDFFQSAMWEDIPAAETCMIGDDVLSDIQGAKNAGIGTNLLVKTGKYREGDENKAQEAISQVCDSIVEAVNYILSQD